MNPKMRTNTLVLVESALMVALAIVLSMVKVFELPQGGSVTCASMVPIVLLSYRHGIKWGLGGGFVLSLMQMMIKFDPPVGNTVWAYVLVVLLDYVLAFTLLGSASFFGGLFKKHRALSVGFGALVVGLLRYACSFISGIVNWGSYADDPTTLAGVTIHSLLYNGAYMIPEIIITVAASVALIGVLDHVNKRVSSPA